MAAGSIAPARGRPRWPGLPGAAAARSGSLAARLVTCAVSALLARGATALEPRRPAMSVSPASRLHRTWLAAIALVGLATTTANCGGSTPSTPADTAKPPAAPAAETSRRRAGRRSGRTSAAALVRNRLAGGGAIHARQAVHRRLRRDGGTPDDSLGGHLQSHVLLRGQGCAEGRGLRIREGLRGRAEQEAQDGQHEGQRRLRAAAA